MLYRFADNLGLLPLEKRKSMEVGEKEKPPQDVTDFHVTYLVSEVAEPAGGM